MHIDIQKITNARSYIYGNYNIAITLTPEELKRLQIALDPTNDEALQLLRAIDKELDK